MLTFDPEFLRRHLLAREKDHAIRAIATRSDGYIFVLVRDDRGRFLVRAGCQTWTIPQYRQRVHKEYPTKYRTLRFRARQKETLAILELFEQAAKRPLSK